MKYIFTIVLGLLFTSIKSQILFSDHFNSLNLQNDVQVYGSHTITTTYTTAPAGYTVINDGLKNNIGSYNAPNKPFNVAALKTTGWAVSYNTTEADTFLVSTSWLDTNANVQRFIVTPVINSISANSVLSWEAMAPDINFPDGYEVYVTTNTTGTLTSADFTSANRVFYLADGNSPGQGEKNTWTKHGVSLASYAGQNIRIAFKNISQNMYQLWIDDITVEDISTAVDAELSAGNGFYKYNTPNTFGPIICRVTNRGTNTIGNISLNYSIIGISNISQTFILSQPLTPYAVSDFTFSAAYNISTPGYYQVKIWVNGVNSTNDGNKLNDTINSFLCIVTSAPAKNILAEQFLSAADGYSPDGQEKLKALTASSVISVNIHDADSLSITDAANLISTYRKKTTTAMVDRTYFTDIKSVAVEPASYTTRINQRKSVVVPVSVSISNKNYDSITRVLTFTVSAAFTGEVRGDYRINALLTENNVYGPVSDTTFNGWNQLSFMYNVPFSPYFQTGYYYSPLNGYVLNPQQYRHMSVLNAMLDGSFGVPGIIPTTGGTQAQIFTRAYSYTLPPVPAGQFRYNADNMYIVAYVSEYDPDPNFRAVLNCTQDKVTAKNESMVSVSELLLSSDFLLFPNPGYGMANILIPENSFSDLMNIKVLDVLGNEVYVAKTNFHSGLVQLNLMHLQNGSYFMVLDDGRKCVTKKLLIAR